MGHLMSVLDQAEAPRPIAAEFFAGIGLVRMGLEAAGFDVRWSNDIDPDKQAMYQGHFRPSRSHKFVPGDISKVKGEDLPDNLALAWASFPCVDLSLAGWRRGLKGKDSGTFWHFTEVLDQMDDRRPPVVVLENVVGLATSHGGEDLAAAIGELNRLGYSVDVLTLDARRFVPQSRPRLFVVGAIEPPAGEPELYDELRPDWLQVPFHNPALRTYQAALPAPPPLLTAGLAEMVEKIPAGDERWWDEQRTAAFLDSLSEGQAARLKALCEIRSVSYRTAYRRTRDGVPMWEIRPDDVSGCLRTARGGSSKQALVKVGGGKVRVRWMTPREYARLMGARGYRLSGLRRNQALFGFGDAVCVPAVAWLAEHYLMPLVRGEMGVQADDAVVMASA
ncbi:MAG TPA: DNA cytosine methyltransferase [Streptosporangiaceae bacterium]